MICFLFYGLSLMCSLVSLFGTLSKSKCSNKYDDPSKYDQCDLENQKKRVSRRIRIGSGISSIGIVLSWVFLFIGLFFAVFQVYIPEKEALYSLAVYNEHGDVMHAEPYCNNVKPKNQVVTYEVDGQTHTFVIAANDRVYIEPISNPEKEE